MKTNHFKNSLTSGVRLLGLFIALIFLAVSIGGCSLGPKRSGVSYVIKGKRYYILASSEGYNEKGIASWYGKPFHGRKTASGEVYNMYSITAAHKTLPLNTWVEVKNLKTKKTIIVRINDRGPFIDGRIIDLSQAAAKELGIYRAGVAPVSVVALPRERIQRLNEERARANSRRTAKRK
jgi:rare lipoprotein A